MINNEILEEIIYISFKNRFIDKEIITKIIFDVIDDLDIEIKQNLKKIKFEPIKFGVASFSKRQGTIKVDLNKIYRIKTLEEYSDFSMLSYNLFIVQCLLHEIEHLKEIVKRNENTVEGRLIKYSDRDIIFTDVSSESPTILLKRPYEFYKKLYNLIPNERIANINSSKILLQSLYDYPFFLEKYFYSLKTVNDLYIDYHKVGYFLQENGEYSFPMYDYLCNVNIKFKLDEFNNEKEKILCHYDSKSKMKYGLPITHNDINNIEEEKRLIKRIS